MGCGASKEDAGGQPPVEKVSSKKREKAEAGADVPAGE
jgi:hypothetical protein